MGLILIVAVVLGSISVVGALATAIWGPHARARRRLRSGIADLVDGEVVTLVGKVRALSSTLTAPLSGRSCVGFEALARLYEGPSNTTKMREQIVERGFVSFTLETKRGIVHVEATADTSLAIPPAPVIPRSLVREREFLANHEKKTDHIKHSGFDEVAIVDGDVVAVQGMAVIEAIPGGDERGYRDVAQRARIVAHPEHPLTIGPP